MPSRIIHWLAILWPALPCAFLPTETTVRFPGPCPLPSVASFPWCLHSVALWGIGLSVIKLNLVTVKIRTVTMITRGNSRPDFCHLRARVGIISHMCACVCFREGLPQLPKAAKCGCSAPAWTVLVPFLLAERCFLPLALVPVA